jgi:hypothetical protein
MVATGGWGLHHYYSACLVGWDRLVSSAGDGRSFWLIWNLSQEVLDALDDVVVWYHTGLFFKAGSRYYAHKLYVASSTQHKQINANANRPELDMQVSSFYFSLINFSSTLEVRITPPQIIMLHIHTNTKTVIKIIANAHTHTDKVSTYLQIWIWTVVTVTVTEGTWNSRISLLYQHLRSASIVIGIWIVEWLAAGFKSKTSEILAAAAAAAAAV